MVNLVFSLIDLDSQKNSRKVLKMSKPYTNLTALHFRSRLHSANLSGGKSEMCVKNAFSAPKSAQISAKNG